MGILNCKVVAKRGNPLQIFFSLVWTEKVNSWLHEYECWECVWMNMSVENVLSWCVFMLVLMKERCNIFNIILQDWPKKGVNPLQFFYFSLVWMAKINSCLSATMCWDLTDGNIKLQSCCKKGVTLCKFF